MRSSDWTRTASSWLLVYACSHHLQLASTQPLTFLDSFQPSAHHHHTVHGLSLIHLLSFHQLGRGAGKVKEGGLFQQKATSLSLILVIIVLSLLHAIFCLSVGFHASLITVRLLQHAAFEFRFNFFFLFATLCFMSSHPISTRITLVVHDSVLHCIAVLCCSTL